MTLLQQAIRTLEEEIAAARSGVKKSELLQEAPVVATATSAAKIEAVRLRQDAGLASAWKGYAAAWDAGKSADVPGRAKLPFWETKRRGGLSPVPDSRPEKMMQRSGCDLCGMSNTIQQPCVRF